MKRFLSSFTHKSDIRFGRSAGLPILLFLIYCSTFLYGCSKNDEPDQPAPTPQNIETSVLIYAVASNNLSSFYIDDMMEMLEGIKQTDPNTTEVWVYSLTNKQLPSLKKVVWQLDEPKLLTVKEYDRTCFSTDPERISDVIGEYLSRSTAEKRGMIFWSHATGWLPNFSDHQIEGSQLAKRTVSSPSPNANFSLADESVRPVANGSYGVDIYEGKYDYCDITELADAIPDATFDFIWFDCCYMSSIELYYQLRNKANWFVGSPMEVAAAGMPYHLTIPHIVKKDFDLVAAADAMVEYYLTEGLCVAMAVVDASHLQRIALMARDANKGVLPAWNQIDFYSRNLPYDFYDFGQFTLFRGQTVEGWDAQDFKKMMDELVIYKKASEKGFNYHKIDPATFSGLTVHLYEGIEDQTNDFYRNLDWYKAVYDSSSNL